MGRAKEAQMEAEERGWRSSSTFVCDRCVEDAYLKDLIKDAASEIQCSYCERRSRKKIAASSNVILEPIAAAVFRYYNDPSSAGVPFDEGAYIIESDDVSIALDFLGFECHEKLFEDICDAFFNRDLVWAPNGYCFAERSSTVLKDSWDSFARAVKHHTRFHFAGLSGQTSHGPQELTPSEMLTRIGDITRQLNLVRSLEERTPIFRARIAPSDDWSPSEAEMGAPPCSKSPGGHPNSPSRGHLKIPQ